MPALAIPSRKLPLVAVIGLACVVGSPALAWFSSPATLQLTRGDRGLVQASIESRLFGLFLNKTERIDSIRAVSLVRGTDDRQYKTPDRIVFDTTSGPVDLGRNQQLFMRDHAEIARFFPIESSDAVERGDGESSSPPLHSLTLSSIARGQELRRFLIAQTLALFLLIGGLGLEWLAVRGLVAGRA